MSPCRLRQSGFSLPTAIFLLVVLAALGAFMLTLSTAQHVSSAQDIQGSQAYRAARAGIEWGAARVKAGNACTGSMTVEGYAVTVTCTAHTYNEGGVSRTVHWFTSTAATGGAPGGIGYIERVVNGFVEF